MDSICDYCKSGIKPNEICYQDFEYGKNGNIINKLWHIECYKRTNKNIIKTIGNRLMVLMTERDLTEEEFEKKYSLEKNIISKCENGNARLDDEFLVKIALDHGVSLDWLFGLTATRHNTNKGE